MVRHCAIRKCLNATGSVEGASLHLLPQSALRDTWISFIRQENENTQFEPKKHTSICSIHFDTSFKTISPNGKVNLSVDAYPGPLKPEDNDVIRSFVKLKESWDKLDLTGWYYDPTALFIFNIDAKKEVCHRVDIKKNLMVEIYKYSRFVSCHQIKRFSEVSYYLYKT